MTIKGRVVAAMSGGVDSAVAAALLKEEGREVIGLTLRLWSDEDGRAGPDGLAGGVSRDAATDAGLVAARLGIPHYVLNAREEFKDKVVGYFLDEYGRGRTPNPCVVCNREVKFAVLLRKALELEAAFMATGHYARVETAPGGRRYLLKKGADAGKDQSYMLYNLTQEQLAKCLFPLGEWTKEQVRKKAAGLGLPVADKKESQEICFLPGNDYRDFLRRSGVAAVPGPIVDRAGNILGRHHGLPYYTVGQRRGLGIASSRPLYVLELDSTGNTLVVGPREELFCRGLEASQLNWIALPGLEKAMEATVKIRYRSEAVDALLEPREGGTRVRVLFKHPQPAVTPGQAAVFYHGDVVLGGGIIDRRV